MTDSTSIISVSLPHAKTVEDALTELHASTHGLTTKEAEERLTTCGFNALPRARAPGVFKVFMLQFASPLIYILLAAAVLSLVIQEWADAIFITAVLLINAIIGTVQEYSAQRTAMALQNLVSDRCRVLRAGETYEIDADTLVPGDILLLESGDRVPADVRLIASHDLEMIVALCDQVALLSALTTY